MSVITDDPPSSHLQDGGAIRLVAGLESRLSPEQRRVLHLNRALLYLAAGRTDEARQIAAGLARDPAPVAEAGSDQLVLLQAALLVRDGKVGGCVCVWVLVSV